MSAIPVGVQPTAHTVLSFNTMGYGYTIPASQAEGDPTPALSDLFKTIDTRAAETSEIQEIWNICKRQIAAPNATSCSLSIQSALRGGAGFDSTYTCDTSDPNGKPLFVLNRVVDGLLAATWMKNYGEAPRFDLRPEYQISPELRQLQNEIGADEGGTSCILEFRNALNSQTKRAGLRVDDCALNWHIDNEIEGKCFRSKDTSSEVVDRFRYVADAVQQDNSSSMPSEAATFTKEPCPQVSCPELPNMTVPCPEIPCLQVPDTFLDFTRVSAAVFGAAAAYLAYRAAMAAKEILRSPQEVDERGVLKGHRNGLSAWISPAGFGLAAAACVVGVMKV